MGQIRKIRSFPNSSSLIKFTTLKQCWNNISLRYDANQEHGGRIFFVGFGGNRIDLLIVGKFETDGLLLMGEIKEVM